jgi:CheY-like chemotaxis protein
MKILLADDDPVAQKMMAALVKTIGCQADVVSNGREVIHVLQSRSYDVIFMDLQMPEMGGLEAAKAIRDCWPDKCTKIIAVTSCSQKGCREMCIQAGMDGFIAKPAKKEDILAFL